MTKNKESSTQSSAPAVPIGMVGLPNLEANYMADPKEVSPSSKAKV